MNSDEADDREEVIKDSYVCVECGAEFATNAELDFHKRREHPPIQQRYDPREDSTSEEEDDFPFRYAHRNRCAFQVKNYPLFITECYLVTDRIRRS